MQCPTLPVGVTHRLTWLMAAVTALAVISFSLDAHAAPPRSAEGLDLLAVGDLHLGLDVGLDVPYPLGLGLNVAVGLPWNAQLRVAASGVPPLIPAALVELRVRALELSPRQALGASIGVNWAPAGNRARLFGIVPQVHWDLRLGERTGLFASAGIFVLADSTLADDVGPHVTLGGRLGVLNRVVLVGRIGVMRPERNANLVPTGNVGVGWTW